MSGRRYALLVVAIGLLSVFNLEMKSAPNILGYTAELSFTQAAAAPRGAARRVARRTARRTTARTTARLYALPPGCVWRAPYHYCGGIYYKPIVEVGKTVYIVVTP